MKALMAGCLAALLLAGGASALEIEGARLDDKVQVAGSELTLNGAGLRTRLGFKVYAGGLYLAERTKDAAAAVAAPGPKRVSIAMLRDVGAKTFLESLNDGIAKNTPAPELEKLKPQLAELESIMLGLGEAKKGDVIQLDFVPGTGTVVLVNGQPRGKPIPGDDFNRALLRIWLGDRPVDSDLKKAMLGQ
jgi:hypothetical protein